MRASRLLSILILLQLRVRLTAEALAQEFEVSVRTIYRDVDALSAAGVPVYGDRGPGGGFQLLEGYRTRLTGLAGDEAEAMMLIGLPEQAAALGLGPAAARARGKLLASMAPAMGEDAGKMSARFHLDPVDWYRAGEPVAHLPALARAVLDQRRVAMRYESWTGVRDWTIEPLGLVSKAGSWYLVAGTDKPRTFKVSSILALEALDEMFERPDRFDLAACWSASLQRFEAGLRPASAVLRVSPTLHRKVAELGAYAAEAVRTADGGDICLPIEDLDQGALLVLGLGPDAQVIAPPELRARVRALALAIADGAAQ